MTPMEPTPPLPESHSPATLPDSNTRLARTLALALLAAMIVLGLAWELWLAPTGSGTLALKVLPLVLCWAGLYRHRMPTYRWLSLLVWLYFMEGVVRAMTERGISQMLAVLEIVLSLLLFAVAAWYIRWRLRRGAAANRVAAQPVA